VTRRDRGAEERLFRVALLVKGLDGAVELLTAFALALGPAAVLDGLVQVVLDHHLLGGPQSVLAERFAAGEQQLAGGGRTFAVVYLAVLRLVAPARLRSVRGFAERGAARLMVPLRSGRG